MNLFILGNGFDLAHNLPTKYLDFKNYCKENYPEFYNILDKCLPNLDQQDWNNFEESLGAIDVGKEFDEFVLPNVEKLRKKYSPDSEPDINNDHFETQLKIFSDILSDMHAPIENEINNRVEKLISIWDNLSEYIAEWITYWVDEEALELEYTYKKFHFPKKSFFITFNYSYTLEKVYEINPCKICHIHGTAKDKNCEVGAKLSVNYKGVRNFNSEIPLRNFVDDYLNDPFVSNQFDGDNIDVNIKTHIDELPGSKIKKYAKLPSNIQYNKIKKIVIFGHSLSDIDKEYFEEISKKIGRHKTKWVVYYKEKKQEVRFKRFMKSLLKKYKNQFFRLRLVK